MTDGRVIRLLRHIRALWPRHAWWPPAPFAAYAVLSAFRGELRVDHFVFIAVATTLAYIGPRTKELLLSLYPLALVALLYDAMRPLKDLGLTAARVHLCDVRELEARLFGFESGGVRLTLHDWFRAHPSLALDLLSAFPYATFLLLCVVTAVYLHHVDVPAMRRFTWGFFVLNVVGFVTYHLYPAAPPWYFHASGCAVDMTTSASEGPALAHVDAVLGVRYFHGMYGRASSVFGAIPSLHCAYPLLVVIEGWRSFGPRLRAAAITYWLLMIFAAVYLDHHWLLDAVVGAVYAVLTAVVLRLKWPDASAEARAPLASASASAHEARLGNTVAGEVP